MHWWCPRSTRRSTSSGFAAHAHPASLHARSQLFEKVEAAKQKSAHKDAGPMRLITQVRGVDSSGSADRLQVESGIGLLNLRAICQLNTEEISESMAVKHEALILGGDDFAASIGARRSSLPETQQSHCNCTGASALTHVQGPRGRRRPRSCSTRGRAPVPTPRRTTCRPSTLSTSTTRQARRSSTHVPMPQDLDALKREAQQGAQWGFTGKQIIHPNQARARAVLCTAANPPRSRLSRTRSRPATCALPGPAASSRPSTRARPWHARTTGRGGSRPAGLGRVLA